MISSPDQRARLLNARIEALKKKRSEFEQAQANTYCRTLRRALGLPGGGLLRDNKDIDELLSDVTLQHSG